MNAPLTAARQWLYTALAQEAVGPPSEAGRRLQARHRAYNNSYGNLRGIAAEPGEARRESDVNEMTLPGLRFFGPGEHATIAIDAQGVAPVACAAGGPATTDTATCGASDSPATTGASTSPVTTATTDAPETAAGTEVAPRNGSSGPESGNAAEGGTP